MNSGEEYTLENVPLHDRPDTSKYPADITDILDAVCMVWGFELPEHKKRKAFWIDSARQLKDACGEFPVMDIMKHLMVDYMHRAHQGKAYDIAGPKSLVNPAAYKAAEMRRLKLLEESGIKPDSEMGPWHG